VTPSRRSREDQVEDERIDATGYVEAWYPCFTVFNVLDFRGIIVI
jgi:hypothetical protein